MICHMTDFNAARINMVDCQLETNGVITPALLEAFRNTPRELFVDEAAQNIAYVDETIPVSKDRFLLSPMAFARMVEALEPESGDIALDIGGGTGYGAAILSSLVTTVIALETKQAYIDAATQIWNRIGACNIAAIKGSLLKGNAKNAPYNIIMIAGAVAEIPADIIGQLAVGGRLATIIKPSRASVGQATLVKKISESQSSSYPLFEVSSPYLPGFEPRETFVF